MKPFKYVRARSTEEAAGLLANTPNAKLIAGGCKHIGAVDDMLTLNGLRLIWERNHDRHRRR